MTERQLLTEFSKKIKELKPVGTVVYETKMVRAKSFRLASVAQHQVAGLQGALHGLWYKISDSPIYAGNKSRFTFAKPFDALWIKADQAFVVPIFYVPRKSKIAYLIPIEEFIKLSCQVSTSVVNKVVKSVKEEELSRFVSLEL